jgi:hypothetical protein
MTIVKIVVIVGIVALSLLTYSLPRIFTIHFPEPNLEEIRDLVKIRLTRTSSPLLEVTLFRATHIDCVYFYIVQVEI